MSASEQFFVLNVDVPKAAASSVAAKAAARASGKSLVIKQPAKIDVPASNADHTASSSPKAALLSPLVKTFTCFSKLPIELRLIIWRFAFPPSRRIKISNRKGVKMGTTVRLGILPLPITLHINNESRRETLKHYCIVFRQDSPHKKIMTNAGLRYKELPLCFDPAKDHLYLPIDDIGLQSTFEWFGYLDSRIDGGLKSIKYLEIRDAVVGHLIPESQPVGTFQFSDVKHFISLFTGLLELRITFIDTMENLSLHFRPRNRRIPYLFRDETFDDMLLRVAGKKRTWPKFFGIHRGSSIKLIRFQKYLPVTVYSHGNGNADYWNGWE